jgi:hypothetical protein
LSGGADPALQLRRLIFGQVISQVTATVARLGVPDLLAAGPRPVPDLAAELGADADGVRRLLRAAAGIGLLDEVGPQVFAVTELGKWLGSRPPSLRDLAVAIAAPGHSRSIERLAEAVTTGRPVASEALGTDIWDYFARTPEEGSAFAAVLAAAPEELASRGLSGRVELVAGDFLSAVPSGGDLYLLKHIVHDWDDTTASLILGNCRRAAGDTATLVLLERLVTPDSDPVTHLADLLMLVMFGGRERTREEYDALLAGAGWHLDRVVQVGMLYLLEASPA